MEALEFQDAAGALRICPRAIENYQTRPWRLEFINRAAPASASRFPPAVGPSSGIVAGAGFVFTFPRTFADVEALEFQDVAGAL